MIAHEDAVAACQEIGLTEGTWLRDVRAGRCQITTLTADVVVLTAENGEPVALDGAAELLEWYQNEHIELVGDEP